jgi:hypothetical protein
MEEREIRVSLFANITFRQPATRMLIFNLDTRCVYRYGTMMPPTDLIATFANPLVMVEYALFLSTSGDLLAGSVPSALVLLLIRH